MLTLLSTSLSPGALICDVLVLVDFFQKIDIRIHKGESLEVPATFVMLLRIDQLLWSWGMHNRQATWCTNRSTRVQIPQKPGKADILTLSVIPVLSMEKCRAEMRISESPGPARLAYAMTDSRRPYLR